VKENSRDYIIWKAGINQSKAQNPDMKAKLISDIAELIECLPESSHLFTSSKLSGMIKPKKAWIDALLPKAAEGSQNGKGSLYHPKSVSQNDYEKYGFYEDNNCYHFRTNKESSVNELQDGTFYHLSSIMNAKRITGSPMNSDSHR